MPDGLIKCRLSVLYQSEYFQQQSCALCLSVGFLISLTLNMCVSVHMHIVQE